MNASELRNIRANVDIILKEISIDTYFLWRTVIYYYKKLDGKNPSNCVASLEQLRSNLLEMIESISTKLNDSDFNFVCEYFREFSLSHSGYDSIGTFSLKQMLITNRHNIKRACN